MNIIIPASGKGSRFSSYDRPKPFIDINGEFMIVSVIKSLNLDGRYTIIVTGSEYDMQLNEQLKKLGLDFAITGLRFDTPGPAFTAMLAGNRLDDDELIIANCDQICNWNSNLFLTHVRQYDAGVLVTENNNYNNGFVQYDENSLATCFVENEVATVKSLTGIHYWNNGMDYVNSCNQMIKENNLVDNEFKISLTFNYMLKDNKKITTYPIEKNNINVFKNPKDLDNYFGNKVYPNVLYMNP